MDLRTYRKEKRLTLADLAPRLGCTEATLSRYETGAREPDLDFVRKCEDETAGQVTLRDWVKPS